MLLGQELKFKNKLCNLKLGTFFSALPGLGASALSGRVPTYPQLRPNVPPTASQRTPNCVPMYRQLRPDVPPSASRRIAICVGTWKVVRRHAVLGASGAQLLAMWVSWLIGGKAKM